MHFVIVDDDISIIQILKNIINEYKLGTVLGTCSDGISGVQMIRSLKPDIALIDLLMPKMDGMTMLRELEDVKDQVAFIVISENRSQALLSMVYEQGIEYYIHKPINVVEVVSVIKKTDSTRHLKKFLNIVSQSADKMTKEQTPEIAPTGRKINRILYELGIIGEAGSKEILRMVDIISALNQATGAEGYQLSELYNQVSLSTAQDVKTIEQRVRRTIAKALSHLAALGIEDFYNDKFQEYNNVLFDFQQVRQEMTFLQEKSPYRGKINIRKFIEGLLFLSQN